MPETKAWAVLSEGDDPDRLAAYGNGKQFQYPVFYSKRDAEAWRAEAREGGRIVRATITIEELKG